ncbi:hypothetical protein H6P81_017080 [Aristolochia fimbriata]|uniref:Uncharacterized protein n=1 Tax=Aristolochia fimbriata TaxID=158543 RepID=A0AAV7E084_ARIFI|nr:hypothetical protein H6P81_017080 [Aristolochia fimbriata]
MDRKPQQRDNLMSASHLSAYISASPCDTIQESIDPTNKVRGQAATILEVIRRSPSSNSSVLPHHRPTWPRAFSAHRQLGESSSSQQRFDESSPRRRESA